MNVEKIAMVKTDCSLDVSEEEFFPCNPFQEQFNADFWKAVSDLYQDGKGGKSWSAALTEIRVDAITKRFEDLGKDVIVGLMEDIYDRFYQRASDTRQLELMPSFIQQLSEIVGVILNKDYNEAEESRKKSKYSKLLKWSDGVKGTVLHLVASRNLTHIGKHIMGLYPGQCYIKSSGSIGKKIPLELALESKKDKTASILVNAMLNERVRQLFEFDEAIGRCKFSFSRLVEDTEMKETVVAVLDSLINPDFPFVPVPPDEEKEAAWSRVPDIPMRYHVHFRLLDGDENGRPAKIKDLQTGLHVKNDQFNHLTPSGLFSIANSPFSDDIIGHPAVRLLVQRKWKLYGAMRIRMYAMFYVIYLLLMTLAFFLPTTNNDRSKYDTSTDKFRMFCEIAMYIVSFVYIISEIDQMIKEKMMYWKDVFNLLDLLGLIAVLSLIPIKMAGHMNANDPSKLEWSFAAVAYLINFIRIFKYFPAFKQIGVYSKTFAEIFYKDISKFFLLYTVVMAAFTGTVILAIEAEASGFQKAGIGKWEVFLQEIRALTEGQGFADSYIGSYRTVVIVLLMINMFFIIVMLTNILIGQLSYRYENALTNARIQYDLDRTKIITTLENSRFRKMNSRIHFYTDAIFINQTDVVNELLQDWQFMSQAKKKHVNEEKVKEMMLGLCKKRKVQQLK